MGCHPPIQRLRAMQSVFVETAKQVNGVDLEQRRYHLLVGLKEEKVVSSKKTLELKAVSKKTVQEVVEGMRRVKPPLSSIMSSRLSTIPHGQRALRRLRRNRLRTLWEILAVCP